MDFGELEIYDFSGFRFYYGLTDRAHILVETTLAFVDLSTMKRYGKNKIHALLRLTDPPIHFIHDNLEVRLDKRVVQEFVNQFPDYSWALRDQLEKMSIFGSNLRFHLDGLLRKLQEILEDYSRTNYHGTKEGKKHFVRRVISNFDQYLQLDELALSWVNFIDCLIQYPHLQVNNTTKLFVVNTWRSFIILQNNQKSTYPKMYYPYSPELFQKFEKDENIELLNLVEENIDQILDPVKCRIHNSTVTTTNPIRTI